MKCNRVGNLRIAVQFSEPLEIDLTMMMFCEHPATLLINKKGKVSGSFLCKYFSYVLIKTRSL